MEKYQKRLKQISGKLVKTITTKDSEVKELYTILYSLINDEKARKTFLKKPGTSRHDLTMLNSKLAAAASEEGYRDYLENQKAKKELFS